MVLGNLLPSMFLNSCFQFKCGQESPEWKRHKPKNTGQLTGGNACRKDGAGHRQRVSLLLESVPRAMAIAPVYLTEHSQ